MTNQKAVVFRQLEKHLPANAVHYCFDLWADNPFRFVVSRARSTKLGDYRYDRTGNRHVITVNHNLNPFSFLITYIHEVAHLVAGQKTGNFHKPHGSAWKSEFKALLSPMMNDLVFPQDVLEILRKHMLNPKATSHSDPRLVKALRNHDPVNGAIYLSDIQAGLAFDYKGRHFRKEQVRRTRAVCIEVATGKKYLISEIAEVVPLG